MATTPESPSWSSVMMYSKPWPANVRSVPPPAEPKLGERPVITLACSKVTSLATSASPKEGRDTVTACTPGGALDTSHCQGAIQTVEPLSSLQSFYPYKQGKEAGSRFDSFSLAVRVVEPSPLSVAAWTEHGY